MREIGTRLMGSKLGGILGVTDHSVDAVNDKHGPKGRDTAQRILLGNKASGGPLALDQLPRLGHTN